MCDWEGEFLEKASIITFSLLHTDTCTLSAYSVQSYHNKPQPHKRLPIKRRADVKNNVRLNKQNCTLAGFQEEVSR